MVLLNLFYSSSPLKHKVIIVYICTAPCSPSYLLLYYYGFISREDVKVNMSKYGCHACNSIKGQSILIVILRKLMLQ